MNCVKCGSALPDGTNFCMICGTPVGTSAPQAAPAPAPAPAPQAVPAQAPAQKPSIPYYQPVMDGANITLPLSRKFRVRCPDCGIVSDDIKRDMTVGFPSPACKKAYAYGGQLLLYRMGNGMPSCSMLHVDIMIDGVPYGEITNRESVRIMLSSGTHIIGMRSRPAWPYSPNVSNQFQIVVGPQSCNLAFKLSIVYRYMATNGLELAECAPQEIPDI